MNESQSLEIFRRMCRTRYFELNLYEQGETGDIYCPFYLSVGQESISAAVSTEISDCLIFGQHRAHSVYLAFGGDPIKLRDELLGRETGCCNGRGGSPCAYDPDIGMIPHHGLIGENIPLGVGAALGSGKTVVCFFGDAAAEEDYALAAMGFAVTHKLPVLFVCEDNDLSVLTRKAVRRNWRMAKVTEAMGIPSADISDDPWEIAKYTKKFLKDLPAYINATTCRHYWHQGSGCDGPPRENRFELVKEKLKEMGLAEKAKKTEAEEKQRMDELWQV